METQNKIYQYYNCQILKVVDGDTVDILVDHGMSIFSEQRFRLYGIDAPEMKGETLQDGIHSKHILIERLSQQDSFTIQTYKDKRDKYGRYLCDIIDENGDSINKWMVENGYAKERYW